MVVCIFSSDAAALQTGHESVSLSTLAIAVDEIVEATAGLLKGEQWHGWLGGMQLLRLEDSSRNWVIIA